MKGDEAILIVCMRASNPRNDATAVIAPFVCSACGAAMWATPATLAHVKADPRAVTQCMECALKTTALLQSFGEPVELYAENKFGAYVPLDEAAANPPAREGAAAAIRAAANAIDDDVKRRS